MVELLSKEEAKRLVDEYIKSEDNSKQPSLQELIDSGEIPSLKGYTVKPGKVSDSIHGGEGKYFEKSSGKVVEYENPPLNNTISSFDCSLDIPLRIMVRTQRISTHDIGRGEIPFKDQILATNHNFMRKMLENAIGTSQFDIKGLEDNSIVIASENLKQIPFENVLRAYMAKSSTSTSLYQHYIKGERNFCGHDLPDNLIANGKLPYVMDTPSTKSEEYDESVSPDYLFKEGICTPEQYVEIRNSSLIAFGKVSQFLESKGLIAVDTKTEHGINILGEIVSQDEIWTMDSSRFWLNDDYNNQLERLSKSQKEINPKSYSKEFARDFSKGDQSYSDEERSQIAVRYIEGIQYLTGRRFLPDMRSRIERIIDGANKIDEQLSFSKNN